MARNFRLEPCKCCHYSGSFADVHVVVHGVWDCFQMLSVGFTVEDAKEHLAIVIEISGLSGPKLQAALLIAGMTVEANIQPTHTA